MNSKTPPSPKTPPQKHISWVNDASPNLVGSPGCCSTPSSRGKVNGSHSCRKVSWEKRSSSKRAKLLDSPIFKQSLHCKVSPQKLSPSKDSPRRLSPSKDSPRRLSQSISKDGETDTSTNLSKHASTTDPSCSVKTFSSTESNGTLKVEIDFPHGGWDEDEDSSDESSSFNLEIVEPEVECNVSVHQGRKRKQSEVCEEDNAILSGMGEEIERQLEAKAERNRLTVPNVKNILRSVITNPYVQAMVRRSIKSGDVAVSGDSDDISFEPRMTRAKAKLLSDSNESKMSDISWTATPHKQTSTSDCQALIGEELNDDSEDDEEYQPCDDEPSDTEHSEREGSERGSERDISMEQSPAFFDTDSESCPATPSPLPRPCITDSATQTNWSEDGIFKVPMAPAETPVDHIKEENIALRTRSKLPLNDTPLEEIEQAFIPPDITPDLYDTTCDNADWQEFLKEFMQPMRSEPEVQNHDDDEEDPEYNVLADEEIIDKEELRMDRAVKVSKRELNELMRELMEFTENWSSDDEDKDKDKTKASFGNVSSVGCSNPDSSAAANNDDMSLFLDAYMSLGSFTPQAGMKTTPPPSRSPNTPTLHTPIPFMSPPCSRTPNDGKKGLLSDVDGNSFTAQASCGQGKPSPTFGKKLSRLQTPGKLENFSSRPSGSRSSRKTIGKPDTYLNSDGYSQNDAMQEITYFPGKLECYPNVSSGSRSGKKQKMPPTPGKPDSFLQTSHSTTLSSLISSPVKLESYSGFDAENCNAGFPVNQNTLGFVGVNMAIPVIDENGSRNHKYCSSPQKEYFVLNCEGMWEKDVSSGNNTCYPSELDDGNSEGNNWNICNDKQRTCETISAPVDEVTLAENGNVLNMNADADSSNLDLSVSLQMSSSNRTSTENIEELVTGDIHQTSNGDVMIDNEVLWSGPQRLVLDQQLRQHVQILAQHFLQTYQHPVYNAHAPKCKKFLVSLNSMGESKQNSAFHPVNLQPALEVVNKWEAKLSSLEGPQIISYMEQETAKSKQFKTHRHGYKASFSPQLMDLMANSSAFLYPKILPPMPFKPFECKSSIMLPSEDQLLVIGLEQFTAFIKENNPKIKQCTKWALDLTSEYLLVGRSPSMLYDHLRKFRKKAEAFKYFSEYNCAPPTSHFVIPFSKKDVKPPRLQPNMSLPELWRNFIFPAFK